MDSLIIINKFAVLIFGLISAFATTYFSLPLFIRKLKKYGYTVPDVYKNGKLVPTMGGLAIIAGILVSLTILILIFDKVEFLLIFYFIVFTFTIFGILDDLVNVGRPLKIFAPFFMALPIALINTDTTLWIGFANINLGILYSLIVAPLYVMVVTNLVNMHSGYNGLQTGLSTIMISFLIIYSVICGKVEEIIFIVPLFGALLAFFLFNKYPANIFEGNSGALAIGSALGCYIVLIGNEILGIIILIPHIVNFLMYIYWKIKRIPVTKFGFQRKDGTIEVPNPLTLKWILPYYVRLTEKQSTRAMYLLTTVFGVLSIIIFF